MDKRHIPPRSTALPCEQGREISWGRLTELGSRSYRRESDMELRGRMIGIPDAIEYARTGLDLFVLRRQHPYILGLVVTDICNLHCRHCRVANIFRKSMTIREIEGHLRRYYQKGARFVYLEGGEPYLWKDGEWRLADVVKLARDIGYLRVHVYTNGTRPLDANPDFTWVSVDGLEDSYEAIRGIPLERVLRNLQGFTQRFAFIFVVNTINHQQIREFLSFVQEQFPGVGVMFYFHTPYYGTDELLLDKEQKRAAIATIIDSKSAGMPVLNSPAALRAILSGAYEHPTNLWWVVDQTGDYQCCRAYGHPEVCEHCGYSSCAEILLARSFNLQAMWTMLTVF